MTIEQPAKKSRLSAPIKLIAASAVSVVLGIGLCSVGGFNLEGSNTLTTQFGIVAFFGGLLGLGVGIVWLFVAYLMNSNRK